MARVPYPDPAALPERNQQVLAGLPPLNVFRMLAHAETAFRPYLRFGGALLADLQLGPVPRELAILQTARVFEADYEWIQHVAIGRAVGVTDEQIAALRAHDGEAGGSGGEIDDAAFDESERALLRFVTDAIRTPRPSDEGFAALQAHFSTREIVELLLVCGAYAMLARMMTALDLDLDEALGGDVLESARGGRARKDG
jgi:4-carboxymuconolactone decarboxylase